MTQLAFEKTVDAARGKWRGILISLGMDSKILDGNHHPCPFCGGTDRFRFDDKEGKGTWWCQCRGDGESGMALAMRLLGLPFPEAAKRIDSILGNIPREEPRARVAEEDKRASIKRLIKSASLVTPDTPAGAYLWSRCGDITGLTEPLRAHLGIKHSAEFPGLHPALLAMMVDRTGAGVAIHRTYLTPDGHKAPVDPVRKILNCAPIAGSAVRLGPVSERLGIAEGIETALCAGHLYGLPVWAAISANGVASWEPPEGVRSVVVFGDNDENRVGQKAAFACAHRMADLGLDVEVHIPPDPGTDWNDVWAQQGQKGKVA